MLRMLAALVGSGAAAVAALAQPDLPAPEGPVILIVTGDIARTNAGEEARLDRTLLETMDWLEIETHIFFTEGPQRFAGAPLAAVLERLGARGDTIHATALNDYSASFPAADAEEHDVLLALDWNGEPMPVRNKGPIWIIYPNDKGEADRAHNERMVWQLRALRVE
jgi:hypothetical protein